MILEGPMIFIAVTVLTIWHPGYVFGATLWVEAGFHLRSKKDLQDYKKVGAGGSQEGFIMETQPYRPAVAQMV
jgi:hypothetical protein